MHATTIIARETYQACILRHAAALRAAGLTVAPWAVALRSGYELPVVRRVLAS